MILTPSPARGPHRRLSFDRGARGMDHPDTHPGMTIPKMFPIEYLPITDEREVRAFLDRIPLAVDREHFTRFVLGFPHHYLAATSPVEIVKHFALVTSLGRRAAITALAREGRLWKLVVVASDRKLPPRDPGGRGPRRVLPHRGRGEALGRAEARAGRGVPRAARSRRRLLNPSEEPPCSPACCCCSPRPPAGTTAWPSRCAASP